jgi:putative tricarboxylic transport membrane protein
VLLMPITLSMPSVTGLIMLAGIYYGAMYGGSTTSILMNIPGEPASVITCIDGHKMAMKGRAGPALGIAAFGSFIAGTIAVIGLTFFAFPLSSLALSFGPPEYFNLMLIGLIVISFIVGKSILKGFLMAFLGLFLGCTGMDYISGTPRFTFGSLELTEGVGFVPVVMGIFGVAEVLRNLDEVQPQPLKTKIRNLFPTIQDWALSIGPILRGSFLGFFLGVIPGAPGIISSISSYALEKKISRHPEHFGEGAIEGVAGPESANNSASISAYIPLLTFGIPYSVVIAVFMEALLMHDVRPGPLMMHEYPEIFWSIIGSMYIGNFILLVLNLPLIGIWVQLLRIPYGILAPLILLFCLIGVYALDYSIFQILLMIFFALFGYFIKKFDYEIAPMVLAMVIGPLLENAFRRSLLMSGGSPAIFLARPIARILFVLLILIIVALLFQRRYRMKSKRE